MATASCTTPQPLSQFPRMTLTITTSGGSSTNNTCNAHATLTYSAQSPAQTSNNRNYRITVDGQTISGSYNINGITSGTVGQWDFTVNRGTGGLARTISFSVSVDWNLTWGYTNPTYVGTNSASGSVQTTSFPQQHTVSYNANGGSGAPSSQIKYYGRVLTLSTQVPTRTGYKFLGWGTSSTDETPDYQPGGRYGVDSDITLYAIWDLTELIDFNFRDDLSISIPANSSGMGSPTNLTITFTPDASDESANTDFYYRLLFPDGTTLAASSGPYRISSNSTINYLLRSSNVIKLINMCNSDSSIWFTVQISTENDGYYSDTTISKTVSIRLSNFSFIKLISAEFNRDATNGKRIQMQATVRYPKSYYSNAKFDISVTNTSTSTNYNFESGANYVYDTGNGIATITSTYLSSDSSAEINANCLVDISVSDGVTSDSLKDLYLLGLLFDKNIYIYKDDLSCESIEFIEGSDIGFDHNGNVLSGTFIEGDTEAYIGEISGFGKLTEKTLTFYTGG